MRHASEWCTGYTASCFCAHMIYIERYVVPAIVPTGSKIKSTGAPRSNLSHQPQKVAVKVPPSATSSPGYHVCVSTTPVDNSRNYTFGAHLEFDLVAGDHITSHQSTRTTPGVHWQTAGGLVMFTNHLEVAVRPRDRGFFVSYSQCCDWSIRLMQRFMIC